MNYKKDHAICFFANSAYRFALAEMLVNLQQTNANLYDNVVIYHADFSEDDIKKFLIIEPKCIFVQYTYEDWEKEFKKPTTQKSIDFMNKYSHMAYVKFKIFEQLEFYHKVLFLDLDMLVLGDISELFKLKGVAWRAAAENFGIRFEKYTSMNEYIHWFTDFNKEISIPNAGLLYISDENINIKSCLKDGYSFINKFMDYFSHTIDELAISYIIEKNQIPLTLLDRNHYNTLPAWYTYETKIVHFMNRDKVWNSHFMQTIFPQWMNNYKIASKLALFDSEQIQEYENTCVRKKLNEETWFNFLSKSDFKIPENLQLRYDFSKSALQMKYTSDVFWEVVLDLYTHRFKNGLWIRNKELLHNKVFINEIKALNYHFLENEKGLYLYTDAKIMNDSVKLFSKFYKETFHCLKKHLEHNILLNNKPVSLLTLNTEIRKFNVKEYFEILCSEKHRYTILISCKDECSKYFNEFVNTTGLPLHAPENRESYIAVIKNGDVVIEKNSPSILSTSFRLNTTLPSWITIISEGYRLKKEKSSILINNIEYSTNLRGLNFVIVDNISGNVVDLFNIDTYGDKTLSIKRSTEMIENVRNAEFAFSTSI